MNTFVSLIQVLQEHKRHRASNNELHSDEKYNEESSPLDFETMTFQSIKSSVAFSLYSH
jgi:hypothetical protein